MDTRRHSARRRRHACPHHHGFTLLEALMAAGILLVVVVAVTSAVTAGQQHAFEAQQRISGTLAAEELLGRVITQSYDNLPTWDGYTEAVGSMTDLSGNPMPESFKAVGRNVQVTAALKSLADLDVRVSGRTVRVRAVDAQGRVLADLSRFIPEPQG